MSPPRPRQSKFKDVADSLREKIRSGALAPGEQLPSTKHLALAHGVSEETIRLVVKELKDSGDVVAAWGKGVFVRRPRQLVTREPQFRYPWEKARARLSEKERATSGVSEYDTGRPRDHFDFPASYHQIEADAALAARFSTQQGTALLQRLYRTTVRDEDHPIALIKSYLLYEMASQNPELLDETREPWPGGTMHQLWTVGVEIDRIVDEVATRAPTPEEADALGLATHMAVFVLEKTSFSTQDTVVEYSEVVLPGDRTRLRYTVQLERWAEE
ncbi:GntR family transcriptional regulator [Streptomyces sp. NPDC102264]|uniref:GntR family transcriptional regulator n=1 Tax=Streptomyces sp. NPDC102264 TaxID=3366149 RepID=UPI003830CF66